MKNEQVAAAAEVQDQIEEKKEEVVDEFDYNLTNAKVLKELVKSEIDAQCLKVNLVTIPHKLYSGEDNCELDVRKNFVCQKCKNIPVAPIQVCMTCEHLYCNFCSANTEKCTFKKCKSESLKTQNIGRIIRNIMDQFLIKHNTCDGSECEEEYTYTKYVKHMEKECPQNK